MLQIGSLCPPAQGAAVACPAWCGGRRRRPCGSWRCQATPGPLPSSVGASPPVRRCGSARTPIQPLRPEAALLQRAPHQPTPPSRAADAPQRLGPPRPPTPVATPRSAALYNARRDASTHYWALAARTRAATHPPALAYSASTPAASGGACLAVQWRQAMDKWWGWPVVAGFFLQKIETLPISSTL
ncbi:hypothetical protein ACQJBY_023207 [Aegilops geniculata]